MTARSRAIDPTRVLSPRFEKYWYAYAVAGAGALAVAPAADAGIIFTPANTTLMTSSAPVSGDPTMHLLNIDLDNDGTKEFVMNVQVSSAGNLMMMGGSPPGAGNGVYRTTDGHGIPASPSGTTFGPPPMNFSYDSNDNLIITNSTNRWQNVDAFLGVRFHLPSDPNPADFYYGWIHLMTTYVNNMSGQMGSVTLKGYAYQNTANTPINAGDTGAAGAAPEPATGGLVLLALGAGAVGTWRKRKQARKAAR